MTKYQTIKLRIKNAKGLYLDTEIYKPETKGRRPVVFMFHGFTGYKEGADLVDIAKKLVEKGMVSVRFTASGFGGSDGTLAADYRFSNFRKDADSVYDYVTKFPYVDIERIGVYGHSMGGKLAALFCYDHAATKALCIVSAPVDMIDTAYGKLLDTWKETGFFEKVSSRDGKTIRVPYEYVVDADNPRHDVLEASRHVFTPQALVISGDKDIEVPWKETKKIYEALHCPKKFLLLKNIEHKYGKNPEVFPIVHAPIIRFFKKYL